MSSTGHPRDPEEQKQLSETPQDGAASDVEIEEEVMDDDSGSEDWEDMSESSDEGSLGDHSRQDKFTEQLFKFFLQQSMDQSDESDDDECEDDDSSSSADEDEEDADEVSAAAPTAASASSPGTEGPEGEGAVIKYTKAKSAEFAAAVAKAPRIKLLSLAELKNHTQSDSWGRSRPDKHVSAVVKALEAGTSDVTSLELENAEWAGDRNEDAESLLRLLEKYSKSLRSLSLTNRLLVQPNGKNKKTFLKVIAAMPRLEELTIIYKPLTLHYYSYRSQFDPTGGKGRWMSKEELAKTKKKHFLALKSLRLDLTEDWFEQQFQYVIPPVDLSDYEYEEVGGGDREEEQEGLIEDILVHQRDVITELDMAAVLVTHGEDRLPIVDLFAELVKLRAITLRVEYLNVTTKMELLEAAAIVFHRDPPPGRESVEAAASFLAGGDSEAAWARLRSLTLSARTKKSVVLSRADMPWTPPSRHPTGAGAVDAAWNDVLRAAAGRCRQLRRLAVDGGTAKGGWDGAAVAALVLANAAHLEEVDLGGCCGGLLGLKEALQDAELPSLKAARLAEPLRQQLQGLGQRWAERGVEVQWVAQPPERVRGPNDHVVNC